MRSFYARGVLLALGALGLVNQANAQYPTYGTPSLLPTAQATQMETGVQNTGYRTANTAYPVVGQTGYNGQANPYRTTGYAGQGNVNVSNTSNPSYYATTQPSSTGSEGVTSPSDQATAASPWNGSAGCTSGACGSSCGTPCYVPSFTPACGNWYGSMGGMVMTRDHGNGKWLSYDDANPFGHLLTSNAAPQNASGGFQATVGRYFNCGWNAVEATFWGVYPECTSGTVNATDITGSLMSTVPFNGLVYDRGGGPVSVESGYDNAAFHMVTNRDTFQNLEFNVLGFGIGGFNACGTNNSAGGGCDNGCCDPCCGSWGPGGPGFCCNGCNNLRFAWITGVRYFRWNNEFTYCSDLLDTALTGDTNEVYYRINLVNKLIGYQIGGRADYCLASRLSAYASTKVGVYANQISQNQQIFNSISTAVVDDPLSPYNGATFDVASSATRCAFLAEIDLGLKYNFARCWSANIGYRAVGVTGVAMSANQMPTSWSDIGDVSQIDSNGSMILHGAYAGLNYNW